MEVEGFGFAEIGHAGEVGGEPGSVVVAEGFAGEVGDSGIDRAHGGDAGQKVLDGVGPVELVEAGGEGFGQGGLDFLRLRRGKFVGEDECAEAGAFAGQHAAGGGIETVSRVVLQRARKLAGRDFGIQRGGEADFRAFGIQRGGDQQPGAAQRVRGEERAAAAAGKPV